MPFFKVERQPPPTYLEKIHKNLLPKYEVEIQCQAAGKIFFFWLSFGKERPIFVGLFSQKDTSHLRELTQSCHMMSPLFNENSYSATPCSLKT